jgi:hypothetical protein
MIPRDPKHPDVRYVKLCVRNIDEPDLGKAETTPSELNELKRRGVGDLEAEAFCEVKQRVAFEDHVGETIAEVFIDVEEWEYAVEYHVEVPLKQRLRNLLTGDTSDGATDGGRSS